jgi:hypothetical protein
MTQAYLSDSEAPFAADAAPATTALTAPAPPPSGGWTGGVGNGNPAELSAAFAGYAADAAPAATANTVAATPQLPPPSVIRPTLPATVQVDLGPASPSVHPAFLPIPEPPGSPPPVPKEKLHSDELVGQERVKDPNDKGFGLTGTWDTQGPKSAPRVTGVSADVPVTSDRIHGDPAELDLTSEERKRAPPPAAASPQPTSVTIPMPQLLPQSPFGG